MQADVEFAPVSAEVKVHACSCQVLLFPVFPANAYGCLFFKQINQAILNTASILCAEVFLFTSHPGNRR